MIMDIEDSLFYIYSPSRNYSPKAGYSFQIADRVGDKQEWWWKKILKLASTAKTRLFLWCIFRNKIPTWDNIQK